MAGSLRYFFAGTLGMLTLWILVLWFSAGVEHVIAKLTELWFWAASISLGFGIQMYLFSSMRSSGEGLAACGGISVGSMVICCLHHLSDIFPLIGAFSFLAGYQTPILMLGLTSNLAGIFHFIAKKHDLAVVLRNGVIASGITLSFLVALVPAEEISLSTLTDSRNGVEVRVSPLELGEKAVFEVSLNTHFGSLDFNLEEVSVLEVDGKTYTGLWEGSPPGGHHRKGKLVFENVKPGKKYVLIMKNIYNADRVFEWEVTSR